MAHFVRTTYEIVTPESAEEGDADERGWIDEEGEPLDPDKVDRSNGTTAVDLAVQFLKMNGATEPNESGRDAAPTWWRAYEYNTNYRTGAVENRSYHLEGFSRAERIKIYRELK